MSAMLRLLGLWPTGISKDLDGRTDKMAPERKVGCKMVVLMKMLRLAAAALLHEKSEASETQKGKRKRRIVGMRPDLSRGRWCLERLLD